MQLHRTLLVALIGLALPATARAASVQTPLMRNRPVINGQIEPSEWRDAAGFDGFVSGENLQPRRVRAWIGANERTIFVAIQSRLPDRGPLLAAVQRDSLKAVYDDAVEVFVDPTPNAADHVDYQFLVNSMGKGGYAIHKTGSPTEQENWSGGWQHAEGLHDGWWHFECAIPVESMKMAGPGRKTTDGMWRINLCRDWKPDWAWSSLAEHGRYANGGLDIVFTKEAAPAVQYRHEGDACFPPSRGQLIVRNPATQPLRVKALLELARNNMPTLRDQQVLTLPPGGDAALACAIDENDPTTIFDLTARVTSVDGAKIYYERATKWTKAKSAPRWVTEAPEPPPPLDFVFAYYPSKNRMRVQADINGLPREAKPRRVTATIRNRADRKSIQTVEFPLEAFRDGRQEQIFRPPPLKGDYEIALRAEGEGVPAGERVQAFERHLFGWEQTPLGRSTKVFPPFTPLRVSGRSLSTVLRTHTLNDAGLLDQVACTSASTGVTRPLLAASMRYVAKLDGVESPVRAEPLVIASTAEHEAVTTGALNAGAFKATFRDTWDYDGTVKVELTLLPTAGRKLDALTLEIPLAAEAAPLIHANSDRIRSPIAQKTPEGEGVVWDASKVACDEYIKNFCPYVYLGNGVRGLCWFAENDRNWGWNPKTPNLDVVRRDGQVILRVHLVNQPTTITRPQTLTFGLLAAPVKPMWNPPGKSPHDWRYRYLRDNYQLLGTDINWLALGDCGSVYPAGQDMLLWEALKKGNLGQLTEPEKVQAIERGKRYFQPYGPQAVETFVRHAHHNFDSHRDARMVYYYNRASCQLFDEFETFKDEWCLDDFRAVGKGTSRGEIKVVPSASYIDYNLYWYLRSFEVGNNRGVYWDNWFIAPSYNTAMTDAFRREDGTIAPAAGIWALRELCKRTFVMMNERGLPPITFPHMTSFSPLPMLSFATVQYEWEWKYSEGDVQDRYTRDYIQLVTTGELAGAWPVPLGDAGPLGDDPWTQRTFSAVRIVHELDGYGGFGVSWTKSHQANRKRLADPVLAMLDKPGLVVYKYWEDRVQPSVSSHTDVPTIVYSVPGKEALVAAVSYARDTVSVTLKSDLKALGLGPNCVAKDVETGEELGMSDGKIAFSLKKHDIKLIRFVRGEVK